MRVIVYTGKGGVGKTSVAAATGVMLAREGMRTLVISTDAAHSLSDAFDTELGYDPVEVAPNLKAVEIDSMREAERSWGEIQEWLGHVLDWAKVTDVDTEELLVFPGLEELFALLRIREFVRSGEYDVLLVDCAPTGETLRLLSFPQSLAWWMDKLFPTQRRMVALARPVAKMVTGGLELPSEKMMDAIERLFSELKELQKLMLDDEITSVRVVLTPEKMVLAEARRSFTYLNLFGFNTDAVIVNRVLPADAEEGYLALWREAQVKYLKEIEAAFLPVPILQVPMLENEVVGLDMLARLAEHAFADRDPDAILYRGRVEEIRKEGDEAILDLAVGFAERSDIDLMQKGDELTVQVGPYKRKVFLPRTLMGRPIKGAKFDGGRLKIRFGERTLVAKEG